MKNYNDEKIIFDKFSTLIRLRICVITQLKYEKNATNNDLVAYENAKEIAYTQYWKNQLRTVFYRLRRTTASTLNKNVIGHAQIDRLEAISFLFFRWLTAILVNSLNQSMFPFYFMLRLPSGPYFSYYSYFSLLFSGAPTIPYFFLKMPYYPYFFCKKTEYKTEWNMIRKRLKSVKM